MIDIGGNKLDVELTIQSSSTDNSRLIVVAKIPIITIGNVSLYTDNSNKIYSMVVDNESNRFATIKKEFSYEDASHICKQLGDDILSLYTDDIRRIMCVELDQQFNIKIKTIIEEK